MLTLVLPAGLALLGTALAALAVFAPRPLSVPVVSFAPPAAPPADPWFATDPSPTAPDPWFATDPSPRARDPRFATDPSPTAADPSPAPASMAHPWVAADDSSVVPEKEPAAFAEVLPPLNVPAWPRAIDPCAANCDAAARLALVEALATVHAPWAETVLRRALDEEPDAAVADAIAAALGVRYDLGRA